ncbi:hypothetical protein [Methylobacterium frigidaeris]|uniref:Uncharacterized protein n=1 Tax=Methylobacterium frigidaeris TaxID=2038277 RepID=A0AA37H7K2_9HYPH|nr:hypothetical protein [Methylobacterium frigidaeris]PIK69825.1 hypothetical protein CS379_27870 [Methylobacterium frigidaeris]GJD60734.1 hypothetical protein MPEAHAMD_0873 [Methylobacterium frigidaeris]
MSGRLPASLVLVLCLAGPAVAQSGAAPNVDLLMQMSGRVSGEELASRVATAGTFPLGSRDNPVRVLGPHGERAFLARLRCPAGDAPAFHRIGSFGAGPYESIIDGYAVRCAGAGEAVVYMDMYHPGHDETQAPAGFALAH